MINKRRFNLKKDGTADCECYCRTPELIENYDKAMADTTQIWECHHRNEEYYTKTELISLGLYYDCPPCELIFLTKSDHISLHHKGKKNKNKAAKNSWNKGKKMSEDYKQKLSDAHKNQSEHLKGKHWKVVDGKRVWY